MLYDQSFVNAGISYIGLDKSPKFYIGELKLYILYVSNKYKKKIFFSFKEYFIFALCLTELFGKNRF